jgi:hypothetical protein
MLISLTCLRSPTLINMVQGNPFSGKPNEDANAHLQHFLYFHYLANPCSSKANGNASRRTSPRALTIEGPIQRTREVGSEWEPIKILLEGDGNSNKVNTASNTRLRLTTQVGQAHVASEVPLELGTNTQPSDPRTQRNTKPRVH